MIAGRTGADRGAGRECGKALGQGAEKKKETSAGRRSCRCENAFVGPRTRPDYEATVNREPFLKSVRMFHKFSAEALRRGGGSPAGHDSVNALAALEATLNAERLLAPDLLEPLAAFTNLLQSSQLPPEFGNYSFADGLLAIEDAHAELRRDAAQRWEFEPEPSQEVASSWSAWLPARPTTKATGEHAQRLSSFVLDATKGAGSQLGLVVGALHAPELPWAKLAAKFERLVLSDLDLGALEELVRREIPEQYRQRLQLERYDQTGTFSSFAKEAEQALSEVSDQASAEHELAAMLASYDVGSGSAGICTLEQKPDLAVSALLLSELGRGYAPCLAQLLQQRGLDGEAVDRAPLAPALELLSVLVEQHHVQALLRRSQAAVLVSRVSEVELVQGPRGPTADSEPTDLLSVERLVERLPQNVEIEAEESWEWAQDWADGAQKRRLLTLVEAVLV